MLFRDCTAAGSCYGPKQLLDSEAGQGPAAGPSAATTAAATTDAAQAFAFALTAAFASVSAFAFGKWLVKTRLQARAG
jgi:hypothetical protein